MIRRHFSCVKFDLLMERLSEFPSLLVQSDVISSSNHFFFSSAPSALTHCSAERWPDSPRFSTAAVVLRRAAAFTQFVSFPSYSFCVSLSLYSSLNLPFFSPTLALFSPLPLLRGAQSSAGCCSRGCCVTLLSYSFC